MSSPFHDNRPGGRGGGNDPTDQWQPVDGDAWSNSPGMYDDPWHTASTGNPYTGGGPGGPGGYPGGPGGPGGPGATGGPGAPGGPGGFGPNADSAGNQITEWVKANFTAEVVDGLTVYDLG